VDRVPADDLCVENDRASTYDLLYALCNCYRLEVKLAKTLARRKQRLFHGLQGLAYR